MESLAARVTCPKCGYVRQPTDTNPDWQCPKCQIAYLKYRRGGSQLASRLAAGGREIAAEARADSSVYMLIAANVVALAISLWTHMSLRELMVVYWIQSVIIGIAAAARILSLERFTTGGITMNDRPVPEKPSSKALVAGFFAMHYGGFHAVYLVFLAAAPGEQSGGSLLGYVLCSAVFSVNHGYSLAQNVKRDALGRPNIGALMILPYARIIPMHLTIVFGGLFFGGLWAFFLFGLLKIAADVGMHTVEHHVFAKGSLLPPAK